MFVFKSKSGLKVGTAILTFAFLICLFVSLHSLINLIYNLVSKLLSGIYLPEIINILVVLSNLYFIGVVVLINSSTSPKVSISIVPV